MLAARRMPYRSVQDVVAKTERTARPKKAGMCKQTPKFKQMLAREIETITIKSYRSLYWIATLLWLRLSMRAMLG